MPSREPPVIKNVKQRATVAHAAGIATLKSMELQRNPMGKAVTATNQIRGGDLESRKQASAENSASGIKIRANPTSENPVRLVMAK